MDYVHWQHFSSTGNVIYMFESGKIGTLTLETGSCVTCVGTFRLQKHSGKGKMVVLVKRLTYILPQVTFL